MIDLKRQKVDVGENGILEFMCPHCSRPEIVYIMPRLFCHSCGRSYNFDAEELELELSERVIYHFRKKKEADKDD